MGFSIQHNAVVYCAPEIGNIIDSVDGRTPDSLPRLPANPRLLGYCASHSGYKASGNSVLEIIIRPDSPLGLFNVIPDEDRPRPEPLCLFVVERSRPTFAYRFCRLGSTSLLFDGTESGPGGDLYIRSTFQSIVSQAIEPLPIMSYDADLLSNPFNWIEISEFTVNRTSYRKAVKSISASLDRNLKGRGERPNWGVSSLLSRTPYDFTEHHLSGHAQIGLDTQLQHDHLSQLATTTDWGSIIIECQDPLNDSKHFSASLNDCMPQGDFYGSHMELLFSNISLSL